VFLTEIQKRSLELDTKMVIEDDRGIIEL
jgi:hypothetical protein